MILEKAKELVDEVGKMSKEELGKTTSIGGVGPCEHFAERMKKWFDKQHTTIHTFGGLDLGKAEVRLSILSFAATDKNKKQFPGVTGHVIVRIDYIDFPSHKNDFFILFDAGDTTVAKANSNLGDSGGVVDPEVLNTKIEDKFLTGAKIKLPKK